VARAGPDAAGFPGWTWPAGFGDALDPPGAAAVPAPSGARSTPR